MYHAVPNVDPWSIPAARLPEGTAVIVRVGVPAGNVDGPHTQTSISASAVPCSLICSGRKKGLAAAAAAAAAAAVVIVTSKK